MIKSDLENLIAETREATENGFSFHAMMNDHLTVLRDIAERFDTPPELAELSSESWKTACLSRSNVVRPDNPPLQTVIGNIVGHAREADMCYERKWRIENPLHQKIFGCLDRLSPNEKVDAARRLLELPRIEVFGVISGRLKLLVRCFDFEINN